MTKDETMNLAREIACIAQRHGGEDWKRFCRQGEYDSDHEVRGAYLGILVGRGEITTELLEALS
jgi:hypothetical protein